MARRTTGLRGRLEIKVPIEEREEWGELATQKGTTVSDLVREDLDKLLRKLEREKRSGETCLFQFKLDPELGERLVKQAERHNTDATTLIRQAVGAHVAGRKRRAKAAG